MRMVLPVVEDLDSLPEGENLIRNSSDYGGITATKEKKTINVEVRDLLEGQQGCEHPIVNPRVRGKTYR